MNIVSDIQSCIIVLSTYSSCHGSYLQHSSSHCPTNAIDHIATQRSTALSMYVTHWASACSFRLVDPKTGLLIITLATISYRFQVCDMKVFAMQAV